MEMALLANYRVVLTTQSSQGVRPELDKLMVKESALELISQSTQFFE